MRNKLFIILASMLLLNSCDDILYKDPVARTSFLSFYQTDENLLTAIAGIYDPVGWMDLYARNWYVFDAMGGDSQISGSGPTDQPEVQNLMLYTNACSRYSIVSGFWSSYYIGIANANTFIKQVSENVNSKSYKNNDAASVYLGEAYFLRAFYYFELTKIYGPVVLMTENIDPAKLFEQSNRASGDDEVGTKQKELQWAQIEADLQEAIKLLKPKASTATGHVSLETAYALLTKKYIFNKEWTAASATADKVTETIPISNWVEFKYHNVFKKEYEGDIYDLFSAQFVQEKIGSYDKAHEANIRTTDKAPRKVRLQNGSNYDFGGYGLGCPDQAYVDLFEDGDPRLDLISKEGDSLYFSEGWAYYLFDGTCHFTGHTDRKTDVNWIGWNGASQNEGVDFKLIRYADVLLWKAEAEAELGNLGTAAEYVNYVHQRARKSTIQTVISNTQVEYTEGSIPADVTFSNQTDALDYIFDERRRELGMEGHTFFDVVRAGRTAQFAERGTDVHGRAFEWTEGVNNVLPIPYTEVLLHRGNLIQNPGY